MRGLWADGADAAVDGRADAVGNESPGVDSGAFAMPYCHYARAVVVIILTFYFLNSDAAGGQ